MRVRAGTACVPSPPRSHARRRALAHLLEDAGGQHAGHVRRRRGRAQVLQA